MNLGCLAMVRRKGFFYNYYITHLQFLESETDYCHHFLQQIPKASAKSCASFSINWDHYSCRNSFNEWKALAKILDTSYYENAINEDVDQTIRDCWEERADWWPQYHFQEKQLLKISSFTECDWEIVLEKG